MSRLPVRSSATSVYSQPDSTPPGRFTPKQTRWDEYSGEPTTSGGKPASVKPGSSYSFSSRTSSSPSNRARANNSPKPETLAEKAARFGDKVLNIDTRPPWKGASGRQAIVPAPVDKPVPATERIKAPPKGREKPTPINTSNFSPGHSLAQAADKRGATNGVSKHRDVSPADISPLEDETFKTTEALGAGRSNPSSRAIESRVGHPAPGSYPSPISPIDTTESSGTAYFSRAGASATSASAQAFRHLPVESSTTQKPKTIPRKSVDNSRISRKVDPDDPISRFSWTTYGAESTYQQSPPPSPPPPMPTAINVDRPLPVSPPGSTPGSATLPPNGFPPTPTLDSPGWGSPSPVGGDSILNRRRPVPSSNVSSSTVPSSKLTVRKALPSSAASMRSVSTYADGTKALPATPSMRTADLIDQLQSQLDDLSLRRRNLAKAMRTLEDMQPANPLVTDIAKRRQVEAKMKELQQQVEETRQEEHDVGLRLHRAFKRRDGDDDACTTLWVRRVTG